MAIYIESEAEGRDSSGVFFNQAIGSRGLSSHILRHHRAASATAEHSYRTL